MEAVLEHPSIGRVLARATKPSRTARELASRYGYLPYMVERYIEILGVEDAEILLKANEEPLPDYIRCNNLLIDCERLARRLEDRGVMVEYTPEFSPYAYRVISARVSPGATPEYLMGYYYLQGPASMSIVHALPVAPGMRVIDMAAAPGGKATQMLQIMRDEGLLVAVERSRRRVKSLRANLQRMRFKSYIILRTDSTRLNLDNTFQAVLLDAPSTGEGIIRKDPSRKRSRTPADLLHIHRIQVNMLLHAVRLAEPGARIVYAACTLAPEEGEMVVDTVLRSLGGAVAVEPHGTVASPGLRSYFSVEMSAEVEKCGRFWPHIHGTEGFFLCRLRKLRG